MEPFIRGTSLQGFDDLVAALGGDPVALLASAGVHPATVGDAEAFLPYRALARLVERAAVELDHPDFGLLLSRRQGVEILGAVALVARHAATAAEALAGLRRWTHVYSTGFDVDLEARHDGSSRYTFTVVVPRLPERVQVLELSLGVSLDLFRLLLGPDFRPRRVLLPHAPASPVATYRHFFGAPVEFDTDVCGFDLDTSALDRPRPGDDPAVRRVVEAYLATAEAGGPADDLAGRVRALVRRTLPTGQTSIATVATHLGLHPRTLQRGLRREAVSFELLVDEVRRERAEHYLRHSDRSLGQIATLLGYTEQSCLSRSARRWFGTTAQDVRAGARHPAGEPATRPRRSPA